jgi:hypothetical protein
MNINNTGISPVCWGHLRVKKTFERQQKIAGT